MPRETLNATPRRVQLDQLGRPMRPGPDHSATRTLLRAALVALVFDAHREGRDSIAGTDEAVAGLVRLQRRADELVDAVFPA